MRTRAHVIAVIQALALGAGCRSTTQTTEGPPQTELQRGDPRTVTAAECVTYNPMGARCASAGETCAGNVPCNWNCPTGPGTCPPPRCGMNRWSCSCAPSANNTSELRWDCRVEMRPAGPLPPPELARDE